MTNFKGNMWVTVICLALSHSLSVYLSVCLSMRCAYAGRTDLHFVHGEDSLLQEDHTFSQRNMNDRDTTHLVQIIAND